MQIVLTGVSHKTAPLAVREALAVGADALPSALARFGEHVDNGVILSTCNRTELYAIARDLQHGADALDRFIGAQFDVDPDDVRGGLYTLEQDDAVRHLFRVASGLDSQIIGESEVLGQVRDAFSAATRQRVAGHALGRLFHCAIRTGKRARTETGIGRNALSVSRACVELARRSVGPLAEARALILGAGEASRLAAVALRDAGVVRFAVANRTPENAVPLAADLDATLSGLDDLPALLADADVVVTATAAPDIILTAEDVAEAMRRRNGRPLALMDVAAPRDVDPSAGSLPGVSLFTLDDLDAIAEANRAEREAEAGRVEAIVAEETARFRSWWAGRAVTPTIAQMRRRAEELRAAEVARTVARLGLAEEDAERVEAMTRSLVKKMLHAPTRELRERNDESFTLAARRLFGLDE